MLPDPHLTLCGIRALLRNRLDAMSGNDRGDAYTGTIMIAIGVVIAITVGAILLAKFTEKADEIDTNTPAPVVAPEG